MQSSALSTFTLFLIAIELGSAGIGIWLSYRVVEGSTSRNMTLATSIITLIANLFLIPYALKKTWNKQPEVWKSGYPKFTDDANIFMYYTNLIYHCVLSIPQWVILGLAWNKNCGQSYAPQYLLADSFFWVLYLVLPFVLPKPVKKRHVSFISL